MKADYLVFRNAEKLVDSYRQEWRTLGRDPPRAVDRDAMVQMGIDAFEWLMRADCTMRSAVADGSAEFDPQFEAALLGLCRDWLATASQAVPLTPPSTANPTSKGSELLQTYLAEMTAIVEAYEQRDDELREPLINLRDAAIEEQRHGTTAEFL